MTSAFPVEDSVGAWVPHGKFVLPPSANGPLSGLSFAVKDVYDVAGHPTGAGNPLWLSTHVVPQQHASLVAQLLAAGATLHGKTLTDELAYSIHGDNLHYGMPLNSAAPDRIPGGSSSGSVAAVAARLVDFALGTDTGGSTRVPASYCGVWGLRTTHGLLSRQGLAPLHPGFDTATWLAHSAATFERVGTVLLPQRAFTPRRALWINEASAQAEAAFLPPMQRVFDALVKVVGSGAKLDIAAGDSLENWRQVYVTAGAYEGWQAHGDWIGRHAPTFAPAIAERWRQAALVTSDQADLARQKQAGVRAHVRKLLGDDGIAVLPSAASVAPLRDAGGPQIDDIRMRTLRICCIAGLAGLPQVSIPLRAANRLPVGVSLLGPVGSDLALIRMAIALHATLNP